MTKRTRRRYSDEFKADAVNLIEQQGYTTVEAARRLGVERSCLNRWRRQRRGEPPRPHPAASEPDERDGELRELREENRKLRTEREILKKAAAFFANESN